MPDANSYRTLANFALTARTEGAIRRLFQSTGCTGEAGLRLTVRSQGWAGLEGTLAAESSAQAGDQVLMLGGVRLFLSAPSLSLLDGVLIDCAESGGRALLSFLDLRLLPSAHTGFPPGLSQDAQP